MVDSLLPVITQVSTPVSPIDKATLDDLIEKSAAHDGQKAISDQALLEAVQGKRKLFFINKIKSSSKHDPAASVAVNVDGPATVDVVVGVGIVGGGEIDLVVDPHYRNTGIGTEAFEALLRESESDTVKVWVHGEQPAAEKLLRVTGFNQTRTLLRLSCPPERALEADAVIPEGFDLQPFDSSDDQLIRELVSVNALAFADHPEQGKMTEAGLREIMREPWFDTEDLLICKQVAEDRMAGFTWIKTIKSTISESRLETELYVIGVHPDFAGKGLGSALLEATFERMATHNPERITLYVEGDNEPALKVYYRAGFTIDTKSSQWTHSS